MAKTLKTRYKDILQKLCLPNVFTQNGLYIFDMLTDFDDRIYNGKSGTIHGIVEETKEELMLEFYTYESPLKGMIQIMLCSEHGDVIYESECEYL